MTPELRLKKIQLFIQRMPSLSTTVTKVLEVCNSPAPSPQDLNRVISLDPVLTGQMLRLINSAYYGLAHRITTLTRAIIMLGINTVKNMVLATSVLGCFKGAFRRLPVDEFWAHSLCVAVTAKALGEMQRVSPAELEEFFVAGLMHDLGKLPIMALFPEIYRQINTCSIDEEIPMFQAERRILGFDHGHVGHLIAVRWRLHSEIGRAVAGHHQPFEKPGRLMISVCLANQLAPIFTIGESGEGLAGNPLVTGLADKCGTTPAQLLALHAKIEQQIEKAKVFLHNNNGDKTV